MALYLHIGCEFIGSSESNSLLDRWNQNIDFEQRLEIMALVLKL